MNELISALLGAIIGFAGAIFSTQLYIAHAKKLAIEDRKKAIVAELIANRYALTPQWLTDTVVKASFNHALGSVPMEFSHNKDCMDAYRAIGNGFDSDKFYKLIKSLMADIPMDTDFIDKDLLENVPGRH